MERLDYIEQIKDLAQGVYGKRPQVVNPFCKVLSGGDDAITAKEDLAYFGTVFGSVKLATGSTDKVTLTTNGKVSCVVSGATGAAYEGENQKPFQIKDVVFDALDLVAGGAETMCQFQGWSLRFNG
jgi:hypothetical protein